MQYESDIFLIRMYKSTTVKTTNGPILKIIYKYFRTKCFYKNYQKKELLQKLFICYFSINKTLLDNKLFTTNI